jgi:hypothetical protein
MSFRGYSGAATWHIHEKKNTQENFGNECVPAWFAVGQSWQRAPPKAYLWPIVMPVQQ